MTKTNEALAKAAEELSKGLAADEPLIVTPASRTNVGAVMRPGSYTTLIADLAAVSHDAASVPVKIEQCFRFYGDPRTGVKTTMFEKIPAGRYEDHTIAKLDHDADYRLWNKTVPLHLRSAAFDVILNALSFEAIGQVKGRDKETIRRWSLKACLAWPALSKPKRIQQRQPAIGERDRRDFVVTKVVIFEE